MTKKYITLSIVAALVAVLSSPVSADMFTNVIDTWGGSDMRYITGSSPLTYYHILLNSTPPVNVFAGDVVESANLRLDFVDDGGRRDGGEYAWVRLDGNWTYLGELNTGPENVNINVDWLNVDGQLQVRVAMQSGDVYLDDSTLSGDFTPVPVPGAILLGILGLSVAGVKLRKFA